MFATPEEAANEAFFGDRLDHFVPYSKAIDGKLRSYWKRVVLHSRKIIRWSLSKVMDIH